MYDAEILKSILAQEDFRTIDNEGKALKPSDPVYHKISCEMEKRGSNISEKHVYTIISSNRKNMHDFVLTKFNVRIEDNVLDKDQSWNSFKETSELHAASDTVSKFQP